MYQIKALKWCFLGSLELQFSVDNVGQILEEVEKLSCSCNGLKKICQHEVSIDNDFDFWCVFGISISDGRTQDVLH